jgi:aminoglycoside phosphotransferase (APT) family kinase protein
MADAALAGITSGPDPDVSITPELVRTLLRTQHPDLAGLPIEPIAEGWDNAVMRLGPDLALRLPRRAIAAWLTFVEQTWLPVVAKGLPLPVPAPVRSGAPGSGYPYVWSVVPWFEGEMAALAPPGPSEGERLVEFLRALHRPAPPEAPHNRFRGVPLAERAEAFEDRLRQVESRLGAASDHVRGVWRAALEAPIDLPHTWFHGDLHGRNVLTKGGRLSAVIDWGDMAAGDAACDLAAVWMLLDGLRTRERALAAYGVTQPTLARARGWAAHMGVMMLAGDARLAGLGLQTLERLREGP